MEFLRRAEELNICLLVDITPWTTPACKNTYNSSSVTHNIVNLLKLSPISALRNSKYCEIDIIRNVSDKSADSKDHVVYKDSNNQMHPDKQQFQQIETLFVNFDAPQALSIYYHKPSTKEGFL